MAFNDGIKKRSDQKINGFAFLENSDFIQKGLSIFLFVCDYNV